MTERATDSQGNTERRKQARQGSLTPIRLENCENSCASQLEYYVKNELAEYRVVQSNAFRGMLESQTRELKEHIESAYPDGAIKHREAHQKQIDDDVARAALKKTIVDKVLAGLVTFLMIGLGFVGSAVWESIKREVHKTEILKPETSK
jgi:hypothetical protein